MPVVVVISEVNETVITPFPGAATLDAESVPVMPGGSPDKLNLIMPLNEPLAAETTVKLVAAPCARVTLVADGVKVKVEGALTTTGTTNDTLNTGDELGRVAVTVSE